MKKNLFLLFTVILSINCYSQVSYEKGYYIDNNNKKIECSIKNIDWENNPTEFKYILSENDKPKNITIKFVKEFGIYNVSKYIRNTVKIDRSSDNIDDLSNDKNPVFKEEELFLKVLIEGESSLYRYAEVDLNRYFYNKGNSIKQLIFKSYKTKENKIAKNYRFRQQLWNDLKCPSFKMNKIKNLNYKKYDLISFFTDYNKCHNYELIEFDKKEKKDLFNLTLRPRLNNSSAEIQNPSLTSSTSRDTDFGNEIGFGFGLEAEFIFPFNKNKWSVLIEPTYQYFKSKSATNINTSAGEIIAEIDYSSIEIPIGIRHYLFLNKNSSFFVNVAYITDISSKSSIDFIRNNGSSSLEIKGGSNFALGIGYKQNNKYSLEIRYLTSRNILRDFLFWDSNYKTLSMIFGYSLF